MVGLLPRRRWPEHRADNPGQTRQRLCHRAKPQHGTQAANHFLGKGQQLARFGLAGAAVLQPEQDHQQVRGVKERRQVVDLFGLRRI